MNWLFFHLGLTSGNSPWYLFPSGVGSIIERLIELAVIGGILLRRTNCEVHGCWRIGRHHTAAGHHVCRVHHPDDKLTAEDVAMAHQEALASQEPSPEV